MSIADRCAAVIPCLNEAATISRLVSVAARFVQAVIVVDDGSTDGTSAAARAAGAVILRHVTPQGKGTALNAGFSQARELGCDWAIALDGDDQHEPAEIPAFFEAAERSRARLVVGNRMHAPQSMPMIRRAVNRWMSRTLSSFCAQEWPDTQCGFRLVHLESWGKLEFSARHFEIESELLVRFASAGHAIDFVPIETRYASERSKICPVRDTIRWLKWWNTIKRELTAAEPLRNLPSAMPALPVK